MNKSASVSMALAVSLMAVVPGANAATTYNFANTTGDFDITKPENWPGGTLPVSPDYSAQFIYNGTFNMNTSDSLVPWQITFSATDLKYDLGAGKTFLAADRAFMGGTGTTVTLLSGTIGVKYDTTNDGRFFFCDNGGGYATMYVKGADSVLEGAAKTSILVGNNSGNCGLYVTEGGTVFGNVQAGGNVNAHNNVVVIDNSVLSNTTAAARSAIGVGYGRGNVFMVTNHATVVSAKNSTSYLPNSSNHQRAWGDSKFIVADHSSVTLAGRLDIGYAGDTNVLEVSGASTLKCTAFNLASEVDDAIFSKNPLSSAIPVPRPGAVAGNRALITGEGSSFTATGNAFVGGYGYDTFLTVDQGARFTVGDTLTIGGSTTATNAVAYFGTNVIVDVSLGLGVGSTAASTGIEAVFDHATLYYTNQVNASRNAMLLDRGISNRVAFVNGAKAFFNSPNGSVYINNFSRYSDFLLGKDSVIEATDNNLHICSDPSSHDNTFTIEGGLFLVNNTANTRTQRIFGQGSNNRGELRNGGRMEFHGKGGDILFGYSGAHTNTMTIGTNSSFYVHNNQFLMGNNSSHYDRIVADGGTFAITNDSSNLEFCVGNSGKEGEFVLDNGATFSFSNINFNVSRVAVPDGGTNYFRVRNGSYLTGACSSNHRGSFWVAGYGKSLFEVDNARVYVREIMRICGNDNAAGSIARFKNGAVAQFNRIIYGESASGGTVEVDNATLETLGDSIQLGVAAASKNHLMYVTGTNATIRSYGGFSMGIDCELKFDIGRYGFRTDAPVLRTDTGKFTPTDSAKAVEQEHKPTIRICDSDSRRVDGGTYTLIRDDKSAIASTPINWDTDFNLVNENPDRVTVIKENYALKIKVRGNKNFVIFVR